MSGHRWYSISALGLMILLAGCQSEKSGRFAWNPFRKTPKNAVASGNESAFSMPAFARRKADADDSESSVAAGSPIAEQQVDRLLTDGQIALQEDRLEDAKRAYLEVLSASPDNATAHHGMAMASDLSQAWADAEYHYRQALRIRPRDANLLCDIGYSYLLQNRYSEASRYLNHAIEINPQHESAQMNLALLDLKQGNRKAAENRVAARFGASAQASQVLAQLESQTNAVTAAFKTEATPSIPENATLEQIQELARRERIEAERLRATRGISQDSPVVSPVNNVPSVHSNQSVPSSGVVYDPRTGLPSSGNYPLENRTAFNPETAASAPAYGSNGFVAGGGPAASLNRQPEQWDGSPETLSSQPPSMMASGPGNGAGIANGSAQNFVSGPVSAPTVMNPNTGGFGGAIAPPEQMSSAANSFSSHSSNGFSPGMSGGVANQSTPNANPAPGFNPSVSAGLSSGASAPAPAAANVGRVIPIHSSGAYQSSQMSQSGNTGSISYGQPIGFSSPMSSGQMSSGPMPYGGYQQPANMAIANSAAPMPSGGATALSQSGNSTGMVSGASYSNMAAGGQGPVYLDGLNAGPGSIFPVGQANAMPPQFGPGSVGVGVTHDVNMNNISSPGSNSMINGTYYSQTDSALPSQEWVNQQQQQLRAQQLQSQQWKSQQSPGYAPQNSPAALSGNSSAQWPPAKPAPVNPLEAYERQRQLLDSEYNRSLQRMDPQSGAGQPRF